MRRILPALQAYSFVVNGELKNARRFAEQEVSLLPIHPFMSDSDVKQVLAGCNGWARSQTPCTQS
jgi:dTDP-4-amino-4,6-dideoxygalactose transaminase